MSPYLLLVFALYAWVFRSLKARSVPLPWPPRRTGSTYRLRGLSDAAIYREILRVVLARPPRFLGTVFGLALPVSVLSLAHAALLTRLLDAWGCRCWGAFLLLALSEVACLSALLMLALATAASLATSVASFYCCDDDRARGALVERLIEKARFRRLVVNFLDTLVVILLYSAAAGASVLVLKWLWLVAVPGSSALVLGDARDCFLAGLLYLGAEYQLAAVVSVLEPDEHARRCFGRSSALLAGNFCSAAGVFTVLVHCFEFVHSLFQSLVLDNRMGLGFGFWVAAALAVLTALCAVVVATLVAHPVIYFTCKTYHDEAIDFGLGEQEPLVANNGVH